MIMLLTIKAPPWGLLKGIKSVNHSLYVGVHIHNLTFYESMLISYFD